VKSSARATQETFFSLRECKEYKSKSKKNVYLQQKKYCGTQKKYLDGKMKSGLAPQAPLNSTAKPQLANRVIHKRRRRDSKEQMALNYNRLCEAVTVV
jgi:hypothetical protein